MPLNQPGGDIIILEPGVTVDRTPGASSLVRECVYMYVCFVHVCARQLGSLWPHHHCVSQPQPVQTCQPNALSLSFTQNHSLRPGILQRRGGGETPELTYLVEYCQ